MPAGQELFERIRKKHPDMFNLFVKETFQMAEELSTKESN